ncbi:uncharacterized protein [Ptychodera flava]|uniref:uncharacterized protein n=1 Tax=Ptychodera flava TaxID=63121 RepID=UPI00396AA11A
MTSKNGGRCCCECQVRKFRKYKRIMLFTVLSATTVISFLIFNSMATKRKLTPGNVQISYTPWTTRRPKQNQLNRTLVAETLKRYETSRRYAKSGIRKIANKWGIDEDVVRRVNVRVTSAERLVKKFTDVILTGRELVVGVTGGSISTGMGVGKQDLYHNTLIKLLHKLVGTKVTLRNAAIGGTSTTFALYCLHTYLDLELVDIIIWEFAYNDFALKVGCSPQEQFTRKVLQLHNCPQLVYVNFLTGTAVKTRNCSQNNDSKCSRPLSERYNIPSVSIRDDICDQVKAGNYIDLLSPLDKSHPGVKMHDLMALFLFELFFEAYDRAIREVTLSMQSWDQNFSLYQTPFPVELEDKHLLRRKHTVKSHCYSAPIAESGNMNPFKVISNQNWDEHVKHIGYLRTDKELYWTSLNRKGTIVFQIDIDDFENGTYDLKILSLGCRTCGSAFVWIDNDIGNKTRISTEYQYGHIRFHDVMSGVKSGKHTVSVQAVAKTVQIVAVIAANEQDLCHKCS